jgi:hypothetical protein
MAGHAAGVRKRFGSPPPAAIGENGAIARHADKSGRGILQELQGQPERAAVGQQSDVIVHENQDLARGLPGSPVVAGKEIVLRPSTT